MSTGRRAKTVTSVAAIAFVATGLVTYRDFGVTWDEPLSHEHGSLLLDFLGSRGSDRSWETLAFGARRFYGPVIPVAQALIDRAVGTPATGYQLGHLFTFFLFAAAVFAFYGVCKRLFGSWTWGLLGAAILVLSPRVFSHAFVNPKDSPVLSFAVVAFFCLVRFLESKRTFWIVAAGVVTGVAIDVRITAIFVVGLAAVVLLLDSRVAAAVERRTLFAQSVLYLGVVAGVTFVLWPLLWSAPLTNLVSAFRVMSHFPGGGGEVTYMGKHIPDTALPWHYVPWWLAITTPIPYTVLAVIGLVSMPLRHPIRAFRTRSMSRLLVLFALWLFVPVLWVIATRAVLYNEWRQMLFVYPAFVVFTLAGAQQVWLWLSKLTRARLQAAWAVLLMAMLVWVGFRMVELHPYEAMYFNSLVGGVRGAEGRYEMDYWGLSYKEGLSRLLRRDADAEVRVEICSTPGLFGALMFPRRTADRLAYVKSSIAPRESQLGPRLEKLIRRASDDKPRYMICAPAFTAPHAYKREASTVLTVGRGGATFLYVERLR